MCMPLAMNSMCVVFGTQGVSGADGSGTPGGSRMGRSQQPRRSLGDTDRLSQRVT